VSPSGLWLPPPSSGNTWYTRTWRIVTFDDQLPVRARIYVAVFPEHLAGAYDTIFPTLERERLNHRHARDAETYGAFADDRWWGGRAILVDVPSAEACEALAGRLDVVLAGKHLTGPTVVTDAKPFGGQTGLLFIRRAQAAAGDVAAPDGRRQRLAQLLNA
jgi:hypothetical protein